MSFDIIEPIQLGNIDMENVARIHTDPISKSLFITMKDGTVEFLGDMFHHQASGLLLNPNLHMYRYNFDYTPPEGEGPAPLSIDSGIMPMFQFEDENETNINIKTHWFIPHTSKIVPNPYILKEDIKKIHMLYTFNPWDWYADSIPTPAVISNDNTLYIGGAYTRMLGTGSDFFPYQEYPFLKNKVLDICQVPYYDDEDEYNTFFEVFILTTDNKLYKVNPLLNQLALLYEFDVKIINIYNNYNIEMFYIKDENNKFYIYDIYNYSNEGHFIDIDTFFSNDIINAPNMLNASDLTNVFFDNYYGNGHYFAVMENNKIHLWNFLYSNNILTHTFSNKIKKISSSDMASSTQILLTNGEVYHISDTEDDYGEQPGTNDDWITFIFHVGTGVPNETYMEPLNIAVINNIYFTETYDDFNNLLNSSNCIVTASSNYPHTDDFTYYSESEDIINSNYIWRSSGYNQYESIKIDIPNSHALENARYIKVVIDLPDDFWTTPQFLGYFEVNKKDFYSEIPQTPNEDIFGIAESYEVGNKFIFVYDLWWEDYWLYPIVGNGDYTDLWD